MVNGARTFIALFLQLFCRFENLEDVGREPFVVLSAGVSDICLENVLPHGLEQQPQGHRPKGGSHARPLPDSSSNPL